MSRTTLTTTLLAALALSACAADADSAALEDETGFAGPAGAIPDDLPADIAGPSGPRVSADTGAGQVWQVRNQWDERDTADARRAGLAWGENSGLSWEEKYEAWIASLRQRPSESGSYTTFELTNPQGKTLPAPHLECAEVAMFLRVAFASWHGLPFMMQGWDSDSRQRMFAGHMGFVNGSGQLLGRFPAFKTRYRDHSGSWSTGSAWPTDASLRRLRLGSSGDDGNGFLGEGVGAGAYFDEMFLNKRVGYFLRLLLLYFGSANLADDANMFHARPEAIRAGDVLLERWQRQGIGHTIPVMRVARGAAGNVAADIATGSMPRRQPVWEGPASAVSYFTAEYTGGQGDSYDGIPYAKLGGGLRRWRAPRKVDGRWSASVLTAFEDAYIANGDVEAIAARPERFAQLMTFDPAERRQALIETIERSREHLRAHPASCSARTRREDAFAELYVLEEESEGLSRGEVDAARRTVEDYVFAELDYPTSKTCCWNSTTTAMGEIVMEYNRRLLADAEAHGTCVEPVIFRAQRAGAGDDGYALFREFAQSIGRGAEWVSWSEDEPCAQRAVSADTVTGRSASRPYCGG